MAGRVEEYLTKGFDRRTAEYFANGRRRIVSVKPGDDYTLVLTFDNGEVRLFDMKTTIEEGTVFAFLADPMNFQRAYVDETGCVCWDVDPAVDSRVIWNNKVDLSADTCYLDSQRMEVP